MKKNFFLSIVIFLLAANLHGQNTDARMAASPGQYLTLYLDGDVTYDTYIRQQITFVNFMRDRQTASLHLLITTQGTGGGGMEYTLFYFGQKEFAGKNDTLKYAAGNNDTDEEIREGLVTYIKMGLMTYIARLPSAGNFAIEYHSNPAASGIQQPAIKDWKNWVFTVSVTGNANGEKSYKNLYVTGGASAGKITDDWKINIRMNGNYNYSKYDYDGFTYISETQSKSGDALIVRSLTGHWSAGVAASAYTSTYNNYDFNGSLSPAIEWDLFPYTSSTSRLFTILYQLTPSYADYTDTTLYDKTSEFLFSQSLTSTVSLIEKWGTVSFSLYGSNYFHDWSKNSLYLSGALNLRIVKGLDLNIYASYGLVHDQLSLPKQGATPEEVLTRQIELSTNFNYYTSLGISYSFGSIYNNVVNARMNLLE